MHSQRFECSILIFSFIILPLIFDSAYDSLDPNGSINIKWDIMSWTPDGYLATVTISNLQMYRPTMSHGWTLGWTWAKKEVIWSMVGAQAIDQGDCSKFNGNILHSCERSPAIVDLLSGVPMNQQFAGCCKGGALGPWGLDQATAVSSFQVSVGHSGTSKKTVKLPKDFYFLGPGAGYACSSAIIVQSSIFFSPDGRRKTRTMMTWTVTCTYSPMLVSQNPNCCVTLSSFYNPVITPCSACACGCQNKDNCTKKYWRVKITITNFDYRMNYSHWNLVVQHQNLNNVTRVHNFTYKQLLYQSSSDTSVFYGVKHHNELLMETGPGGNVQSEVIFGKDKSEFTLEQGWGFPQKVYFNGDECMMPPPDSYPFLPNSPSPIEPSLLAAALFFILVAFLSFWCGFRIERQKRQREELLLGWKNHI
ncbi:hypothetical protein PTKIN_Ptkin04bG0055700 [Pterospermum kingtungense]